MDNPKTSWAGIFTAIAGVCGALAGFFSGTTDLATAIGLGLAAIGTGFGLHKAADAK